ncbi:hypothetical protein [Lacticaseibacillus manihotivorans]|uniref:hypothetical protein n=1 Tax=Lacticaseibacillus manihotivorans TaxID=88233 RepID=UPI0006D02CB5|nr:hypothetical protein [Lacticaseibacillus manihotivorans]
MQKVYPNILTIITTYHCTAACEECCFECSPKLKARLSFQQISEFLKESREALGSKVKGVVFTGGECFTLGDDLVRLSGLRITLDIMLGVCQMDRGQKHLKRPVT